VQVITASAEAGGFLDRLLFKMLYYLNNMESYSTRQKIIQGLFLSLAALGSFALGLSLLMYLSTKDAQQSLRASRAQLSVAEATERQLAALRRFHQGCAVIESKNFDNRKRAFVVESSSTGGNPFLLYAYTEIYEHTKEEQYWQLAKEQAQCLESNIQVYVEADEMHKHPWIKEYQGGDKAEAFSWGTYLHALAYFHRINGSNPSYLKKVADFLVRLDTNYEDVKRAAQAEERRVRGLLRYYDLSTQTVYLERAEEVLRAIDVPPSRLGSNLPSSPYVMAKYLRTYCELYSRHPHDWLLRRIEEFTQAVEAFMEFLRTNPDEGLIVLVYYQMAVAADACWKATSEERFMHLLRETLTKEIANISVESGIIEKGERITLSLNAEITRLLVKYGSKLISNP